jgi:hypothetical protein
VLTKEEESRCDLLFQLPNLINHDTTEFATESMNLICLSSVASMMEHFYSVEFYRITIKWVQTDTAKILPGFFIVKFYCAHELWGLSKNSTGFFLREVLYRVNVENSRH